MADDEELGDIVTETTRERAAQGPAWLRGALSLFYARSQIRAAHDQLFPANSSNQGAGGSSTD